MCNAREEGSHNISSSMGYWYAVVRSLVRDLIFYGRFWSSGTFGDLFVHALLLLFRLDSISFDSMMSTRRLGEICKGRPEKIDAKKTNKINLSSVVCNLMCGNYITNSNALIDK